MMNDVFYLNYVYEFFLKQFCWLQKKHLLPHVTILTSLIINCGTPVTLRLADGLKTFMPPRVHFYIKSIIFSLTKMGTNKNIFMFYRYSVSESVDQS